jgi:hypothetical protein
MQRDWRRRGINKGEHSRGWFRYTALDLSFFLIVKLLTARGVSAAIAAELAQEAQIRVNWLLIEKYINKKNQPLNPTDRFIVATISPEASAPQNGRAVCGFADLEALRLFFRDSPQAIASVVIDLKRIVDYLRSRVTTPLLTVLGVKRAEKQLDPRLEGTLDEGSRKSPRKTVAYRRDVSRTNHE